MKLKATWIALAVWGVSWLSTAGTSSAAAPELCCTCVGCPPGVSGCLTITPPPPEVDVCRVLLGCSSISDGCLPGPCTAGRQDACPADEAGQCDDGFDNDANGLIDCADPACGGDLACPVSSPLLDRAAVVALLLLLAAVEIRRQLYSRA